MRKISLQYIAGFFDGEGCVCISKIAPTNRPRPYFGVTVCVAQVDPEIPMYLKEKYGGCIAVNNEAYRRRPLVRWQIAGANKAGAFLRDIQPYCIVKSDQIRVALKLLSMPRGKRTAVGDRLKEKMHELNGHHGNRKKKEDRVVH